MPVRIRALMTSTGIDRIDVLMVALFLLVAGPWIAHMTAQPAARFLLTTAIVEDGTVELDAYEQWLGLDRIETNGHVYSDKAPLQPLLAVPVLLTTRFLGIPGVEEQGVSGSTALWAQTFVFAAVPGALLLPLMRRHARRYAEDRAAVGAALALGFGTMLLAFSGNLYAHVLVAFGTLLAWHIVSGDRWSLHVRAGVAGVIIGLSGAAEYPVFAAAAIIGVWVLARRGLTAAMSFSVPVAAAGLCLIWWNRMVYGSGSPSYSHKAAGPTGHLPHPPKLHNLFEIFLGGRGLIFTPILLVAIASLVVGLWHRRPGLAVPAGVLTFVVLLQAGWGNPWGGEAPGPRYLLLAVPLLAHPLALVLPRIHVGLVVLLTTVGTISMGLPLMTLELVAKYELLIETHLRYIRAGMVNPSIFERAFGPAGWFLHSALLVVVAWNLARALRKAFPSPVTTPTATPVMPEPSLA